MADETKSQGMNVKIPDEELRGRYANLVRITHTREEFILDFINIVPPQGAVTARIISSPGHIKRTIGVLSANLRIYEESYGPIMEALAPASSPAGPPVDYQKSSDTADQDKVPNVKISDDELKGNYSDVLRVVHFREQFRLDWINTISSQAVVVALVIISPGHLKRTLGALTTNLGLHESKFGPVLEAPQSPELPREMD